MKNLSNFSRREFITLAAAGLSLVGPTRVVAFAQKEAPRKTGSPVTPDEAWRDLLNGNGRFGKECLLARGAVRRIFAPSRSPIP